MKKDKAVKLIYFLTENKDIWNRIDEDSNRFYLNEVGLRGSKYKEVFADVSENIYAFSSGYSVKITKKDKNNFIYSYRIYSYKKGLKVLSAITYVRGKTKEEKQLINYVHNSIGTLKDILMGLHVTYYNVFKMEDINFKFIFDDENLILKVMATPKLKINWTKTEMKYEEVYELCNFYLEKVRWFI